MRAGAGESRFYWRLLRVVLPRALELFVPGYDPAHHKVPPRIAQALEFYKSSPASVQSYTS
ncbi:MAG TPA: hypothetical protein VMB71_03535 [Acetobacteraceae bacterium]|nr:hypothetical protein [Acetobacteraceae bacterium]